MNALLDFLVAAGQIAAALHLAWGAYLCMLPRTRSMSLIRPRTSSIVVTKGSA